MTDKWEVFDEVRKLQLKLVEIDKEGWLKYEFLTWQWWLLLAILIIPWIIFIWLHDRQRLVSTLLVGITVALITMLFDVTGSDYGFWGYPTELVRPGPGAFSFDLGIIPVSVMLTYQFFRKWSHYLLMLVILALVFAFIGEPISEKLELVLFLKWNRTFSFCYYILVGISVKAFTDKLLKIERQP
ncbi:hypothetical protein KO561_19220 [Radiobacillus kanasensis]|uniref:CBO0543 family protein n=1 Tax=Radiobacillus kanasensis TaxID=2844358 RepID=UPI001E5C37D9|nr:CBO0543 family protein [Radiobacillus kanasensis]UFT99279.1 hypothetical protein KO561_19220 [Radiobacillus kanasensis]